MMNYQQSPYSAYGDAESVDGTPDTKFTSFSPEEFKDKSYSMVNSTPGAMDNVHDPFIATKPKSEGKLSATATSFEPFGISFGSLSSTKSMTTTAPKSSGPLPGTAQHLENIIAAEENSPHRLAQSSSTKVTKLGSFTTETPISRHVKVASIFLQDIRDRIQGSIDRFNSSDYSPKSTSRLEQADHVVYLSFADIRDAVATYNAIARDHDNLAIDFIQANELNEINSPLAKGLCSAYEGQVIVQVQYPLGYDKGKFEDEVRELMSAKGRSLFAWEKLSEGGVGTFTLVAEYYDVSHAKSLIQDLHGKVIGVPPHATIISVTEHRPTGPKSATQSTMTPLATPTRQTGETSSKLSGLLQKMSIDKGKAPETPRVVPFSTPITPVGLTYLPATTAGYPFGFALPAGNMYSPTAIGTMGTMGHMGTMGAMGAMGAMAMGNMLNQLTPQSTYPIAGSMTGFSPYTPTSFVGQGPSPNGFSQHEFAHLMGPQSFAADSSRYGSPSPNGLSRQSGYSPRPMGPVRRQNAVKVPYHVAATFRRNQQSSSSSGNHNYVDTTSIARGIDVRTTIMLRNIPNKVTQAELKQYVNQTSFGHYDFMYLRIDFSNDCNVGYAFINFIDPLDICPFVTARANQKWDNFRSDKRAEISYATIQGRDCLIQKFRNSSVMLEPDNARPKLFYTYPHPMVGQEEPFPESDNYSKLTRSCQNAENVGLFAPSAGQHLRDEQRRRRSQYDRGTSLAEQEEYSLEYHSWGSHRAYP